MTLTSDDVECPMCGAAAGHKCFVLKVAGVRVGVAGKTRLTPHVERVEAAVAAMMQDTVPNKPGRPLRAGKPSLERIELRITAAERKRWEKAAGDMTLSAWIRLACERFAVLG